jgi:thermitase
VRSDSFSAIIIFKFNCIRLGKEELLKRIVSGITVAFLLIGMLAFAFNVDTFGPLSAVGDKSNLNSVNDGGVLADGNSAQIVVGVSDNEVEGYSKLVNLIFEKGGEVVNTVSMGGKIRAVVASMPSLEMHAFALEAQAANLSRYVEPSVTFKIDSVPNDPEWSKQWAPKKIGADYAWNTTIGDVSVLVAVIDTGIDWNHPDLAANYVPLGYDWVNNDSNPMDDHGHGTHCAGIIAAVTNNGIGVAGLAQVRVMAEKAFAPTGYGTDYDCANAIAHAVDQGADILSLSWGDYTDTPLVREAIRYAYDAGVLVVAAAGNDAIRAKLFPAAYPEVIAVSATQADDSPASFTNHGNWIDLAAPGVSIYSTIWDNTYAYMSGTSMATPHVAGVAALAWSSFPNMSRDQVRAQLRYTADDLGNPGFDGYYGYGRINARKAVETDVPKHDLLVFDFEIPQFLQLNVPATISATVLNFGTTDESDVVMQLYANGSLVNSTTCGFLASGAVATVSFPWTPTTEASYNITSYVAPVQNETFTENNVLSKQVSTRILKVREEYPTIQAAIDAALTGETILVSTGTYNEHVVVDKTVRLVGENRNTTIIDGGGSGVVVEVNADYVYISGFTMRNGGSGTSNYCVVFDYARGGITFCENTVTDSNRGMDLRYSFACNVSHNIISNIHYTGINIGSTTYISNTCNVIAENIIVDNGEGISIDWCLSNIIGGNIINNNGWGISTYWADYNTIVNNNITGNTNGGIVLENCIYNVISGNNIANNNIGISIFISVYDLGRILPNKICHNNFINNNIQAERATWNAWDDGYPSGGNYWSDYSGVDLFSGPYQNVTGSDGIGDTPYLFNGNKDNYPLTKPYGGSRDIGVAVSVSKTVVAEGYNTTVSINVTITNYGVQAETFNFTFKINTTIQKQTLTLTNRNSTTLKFSWNTTGLPKGNYIINANVTPVSGETDTTDNAFNGQIKIGIPGDVNGDKIVNMTDIYTELVLRFMRKKGELGYSANADINDDGTINMQDIYTAIIHFMQTEP